MNQYVLHNDRKLKNDKRPTNNKCCSKMVKNFITFMAIFTNAYTWCEVLQTSSYIKSNDHNNNTVTSYGYDIIFMWLVTFLLIKLQNIITLNKPNYFTYFIACNLGGLGFALLGEVPFLSNIVITNGAWKHWSVGAWLTIIFFSSIILLIGIRELIDSFKDRVFKYTLLHIFTIFFGYSIMLYILQCGNAKDIHYHVHHAIFAGILSNWFAKWDDCFEQSMHAILMGIVIEGINFYGVGELFLFITRGSTPVTFDITIWIAFIASIITLVLLVASS